MGTTKGSVEWGKKGAVDQFPEIMQLLGEGAPRFPPIDGLGQACSVITSYLQKFIHISRAHQISPVLVGLNVLFM